MLARFPSRPRGMPFACARLVADGRADCIDDLKAEDGGAETTGLGFAAMAVFTLADCEDFAALAFACSTFAADTFDFTFASTTFGAGFALRSIRSGRLDLNTPKDPSLLWGLPPAFSLLLANEETASLELLSKRRAAGLLGGVSKEGWTATNGTDFRAA